MQTILLTLRKVFYSSNLIFSIRMLISLTGSTLVPWYLGYVSLVIPLTLGVVAAGLSEIDTRLLSRCINIVLTLVCFAIATFSVELLFDFPLLFIIGLVCSTFIFIMLGSLGQRYGVIAFGSLLIAAYTMLGHNLFNDNYTLPCFLLLGALWYNVVALIESIIQPIRTTQQTLTDCFIKLAQYLDAKAAMFDPDETDRFSKQTLELTESNNQLIAVFNQAKRSLFNRLKSYRGQSYIRKMLSYYFVAQDIHERASSSHGDYQALSKQFKHSDILFRFARILNLQAKACAKLALSIKLNQTYQHDPLFARYFAYLEEAINQYQANNHSHSLLIKSLQNLLQNLQSIDLLLANIDTEQHLSKEQENNQLVDEELTSFYDFFAKIKHNLTIKSALFRHAIRMSVVLFVGYMVIAFSHLSHGYWIILTSLFVCQPNYSTTKYRLKLRVLGTILGIIVGIPLTYLFPTVEAQLILIILTGWLFFLFKNSQYAYATAFITLLVFFSFSLIGESSIEVAVSRIIATLIGCFIAWFAVSFIWPDWKFRNLSKLVDRVCHDDSHYLALIGHQYLTGKSNDPQYRVARRAAHDSNADLSSLISLMTKEPHMNPAVIDSGFRLLTLNHTLISYLSTLGAHRDKQVSEQTLELFDDLTVYIINMLTVKQLDTEYQPIKQSVANYIESISNNDDQINNDLLVIQQLALILDILPEIVSLIGELDIKSV
ncbi:MULTISPECIES: YccS family putative transporter [unclassified Gilliamella]|uniref:YccS family putative transporter n=1 Tax=unclassified Gilliamella TaxID=2685620 RepID=UPI001C6A478E|nr:MULTISPECIES: YccS family putative transporter [unclassified Gilliamella]MCX8600854.1 TIGR01666 family membrane protein [Gilliamella sp. B3722]MCX8609021.1 TIGR01666 family membrane protein [Gilliamella sp. B3771]MCX8610074.1 TIGR01666 family membrane protein [Gilliamella sp. B3891]MCX8612666.1 TIGR01666 family membrane protein [Gilliamella sp. B3773]MCX8616686.1 TIGR01666 family membrane protein [Gilliamella sp. B3770]